MPAISNAALVGLLAAAQVMATPHGHMHRRHYNAYNGTAPSGYESQSHSHGHPSGWLSTGSPSGYPSGSETPSAGVSPTSSLVSRSVDSTVTSTSRTTQVSTVLMTRSPSASPTAQDYETTTVLPLTSSNGVCSAGTVFVTETERVTVTLSGGAPSSSVSGQTASTVTVVPSPVVSSSTGSSVSSASVSASSYPGSSESGSTTVQAGTSSTTAAGSTPAYSTPASSTITSSTSASVSAFETSSLVVKAEAEQSSSSSSSAPAPSSASYASDSKTKRGIVYNTPALANLFIEAGGSLVSWAYNWGQLPNVLNGAVVSPSLSTTVQFIPQLWNDQPLFTNEWVKSASESIKNGATAVLGFNEPDMPEQANMPDIAKAAGAFKTWITDNFAGKARIGSPAVTNGGFNGETNANGGVMGIAYLTQFLDACSDCKIDFACVHWYDSATNFPWFKKYIEEAHSQTGLPLWLTEFAAKGTDEEVTAFLAEAIPWLESQSYIERYSYFMAKDGDTISGNALNAIGQAYATQSSN